MTITQIQWHDLAAYDIHLLPGLTSPRLIDMLDYYDDSRGQWLQLTSVEDEPDFSMTFQAGFAGAPSAFGVTVDPHSGEVKVAAQLPAGLRLRSFLVTAIATNVHGSFSVNIRVFVHASLTRRWLTPDELSVRQGATNMRFSVLAQFDDGVVGDITNWGHMVHHQVPSKLVFVHRTGSNQPVHGWAVDGQIPTSDAVLVNPVSGEIRTHTSAGGATVHLVDESRHTLASAPVYAQPAWSTPVQVTRIAGPGFAAMTKPRVRNILFVPDGFVDDIDGLDRINYEAHVRKLVHLLRTNAYTRPYDLLSDSLNYFSAWVPSPQAGVAPRKEFYGSDVVTKPDANGEDHDYLHGYAAEMPLAPASPPPKPLTLQELIGAVGPPSPVFDPPNSPLGTDVSGRAHDWQQLYGPVPTATRAASVYPKWLEQDTHVLINERDTAFHCAPFDRPRADRTNYPGALLTFHPLRVTTADFNTFLTALRDDSGNPLPAVWPEGGKDEGLVVILARTALHCGTGLNRGPDTGKARYICAAIDGDGFQDYQIRPDGNGYDLRPDDVPDDVPDEGWSLVAHELAHSLRLGDEYGGGGDYVATPADDASLRADANTQSRADLLVGGQLTADKIKWRWPRIQRAGVLADMPNNAPPARFTTPGNPELITMTLAADHYKQFLVGDIVRLRAADLFASPIVSPRLRITFVDPATGELTAAQADTLHANPAQYPSGSVVLAPAREPDTATDYGGDLLLVSRVAADRINATHNPLNALLTDPPNRPRPTASAPYPVPATNFDPPPAVPGLPRSYQIVGLYDGGALHTAGVYHPTGACLMNQPAEPDGPGRSRVSSLCPVCRYAMVDFIDPTKHREIDADYDGRYPR